MKKYIITIIILFSLIILSIGGYFIYSNAKTNEGRKVDILRQKAMSELQYLSSNIILMMNEINNISYENYKIINEEIDTGSAEQDSTGGTEKKEEGEENSESTESESSAGNGNNSSTIKSSKIEYNSILKNTNNEVDWDSLKSDIEIMYSAWTTVLMDLTSLNVNKDNLLKYNDKLDSIVVDLEKKDKQSTLLNMADLYSLLATFVKEVTNDSNEIALFNVKCNVLYSYAYIESENWEKVKEYVNNAKTDFNSIVNNQVNNIYQIDIVNKSYILINEIEKDISNKSKKTFYINYEILMQELENL